MKKTIKRLLIAFSIILISIIVIFTVIFTNPNLYSSFEKLSYEHDKSTIRQVSYCDTLLFTSKYFEKYNVCGSMFDKSDIDTALVKIISRGLRLPDMAENKDEAYDYLLIDWLIAGYFSKGEDNLLIDLKKSITKFRSPGTSSIYLSELISEKLLNQEAILAIIRAFEYTSDDPLAAKYEKKTLYNMYSVLATFYLEIGDKENYKIIMKKAYDLTLK